MLPHVPAGSSADQLLRESLTTLRDAASDPQMRELYDDVLSGRRSARELMFSDGFGDVAMRGLTEYDERRRAASPEEREAEDHRAAELLGEFEGDAARD
jgi:Spy/CpxP family protein refolding chaperone